MTIPDIQRPRHDVDTVVAAISQAAKNWLAPDSKWRTRAIAESPEPTGLSPEMVNEAIDLTFGILTTEALSEVVDRELEDRRAVGPALIAHFLSGNVPPPGVVSICCGLLVRSANLVRVSTRDPVFPNLFVESLREVDADLAGSVAVLDWPKEQTDLTRAAMTNASAVIAYGNDATIAELRSHTPEAAMFFGYGHRISFGIIGKEAVIDRELAAAAAFDASVYDQQGCLSPHVFYVEGGRGREFAGLLAEAMPEYQARVPRGKLTLEEAAAITQLRQAYEFRSASDQRVAVWDGDGWTVIYDEDPKFTPSCLNRTVFVRPFTGLPESLTGRTSTIGVDSFATSLAGRFAYRVCPIGQMQRPPLSWNGDGRPNLSELISR